MGSQSGKLIGAGPIGQRGISQPDDVIVREWVDGKEDVEKDSSAKNQNLDQKKSRGSVFMDCNHFIETMTIKCGKGTLLFAMWRYSPHKCLRAKQPNFVDLYKTILNVY